MASDGCLWAGATWLRVHLRTWPEPKIRERSEFAGSLPAWTKTHRGQQDDLIRPLLTVAAVVPDQSQPVLAAVRSSSLGVSRGCAAPRLRCVTAPVGEIPTRLSDEELGKELLLQKVGRLFGSMSSSSP